MQEQTWVGHWKVADQNDNGIAGTLTRTADGHLNLSLAGRLIVDRDDTFVVLGEVMDGPITLLDCRVGSTRLGRIDHQVITAGQYLLGMHLTDPAAAVFSATTVRLEHLHGWLERPSAFLVEINEGASHPWDGVQTASTNRVDDVEVAVGTLTYTFRTKHDRFAVDVRRRASETRIASREWTELIISSATPLRYDGFERAIKAVMDLLTMVTSAPSGVLHQTLTFPSVDAQRLAWGLDTDTAELFARQIHTPEPVTDESARLEYLFTLRDITLADVFPKWLEIHQKTWFACAVLFGLRYIPAGYGQARMMASVSALEALHRDLYPHETALPDDTFRKLRAALLDVVSGDDDEVRPQRQYVRDIARNHLSCKERLMRLARTADPEAIAEIVADIPAWAKFVRDARDLVAHASSNRVKAATSSDLLYATETNILVASIALMAHLGLPPEAQRRAAQVNRFWFIKREFNTRLASRTAPASSG